MIGMVAFSSVAMGMMIGVAMARALGCSGCSKCEKLRDENANLEISRNAWMTKCKVAESERDRLNERVKLLNDSVLEIRRLIDAQLFEMDRKDRQLMSYLSSLLNSMNGGDP
jgi:predicted nuclease with TOPRIM domain